MRALISGEKEVVMRELRILTVEPKIDDEPGATWLKFALHLPNE